MIATLLNENPLRTELIKKRIIIPGKGPGTILYPASYLNAAAFDVLDRNNRAARMEALERGGFELARKEMKE